ncbi:hypothetical protein [Caldifermentibacillus hisashii]|uniref:hypothetical protein n=1 Tax=Caldifermentibacillus hisashii TaxID=996558 RepID=UPI0031B6F01F
MTTRRVLVAILSWKKHYFADEIRSRHHFEPENTVFWRRNQISSPFRAGKRHFLATSLNLVTIMRWKTPFFGDEPQSRHHFELEKAQF